MKKILITGENSYIGKKFIEWVEKYTEKYNVETICLRSPEWEKTDFSKYDVVYHVAGIAHIKETKKNKHLYYEVNRDLAVKVANKAKKEGVSQFVFLSSMSVYGIDEGTITRETLLTPKTAYGKSKKEAEILLREMNDQKFIVSIVRPPMVYGNDCKGNYVKLSKLSKKISVFPNIDNKRSMIFIDNLSEFIRLLIDNKEGGVYLPQNKEYVTTSDMVKQIGNLYNLNIIMSDFLGRIIIKLNIRLVKKIFGNLVYDLEISKYKDEYNTVSFEQSIIQSEGFEINE